MLFSSGVFLFIFLPILIFLYFMPVGGIQYKNAVLLLASLLFYAWGEPLFVFVMIGCVIIDWRAGLYIWKNRNVHRRRAKIVLIISIVFHLGILFLFKYLTFFLGEMIKVMHIEKINIALPIGISFFTFQMISYVIDVCGGVQSRKEIVLNWRYT